MPEFEPQDPQYESRVRASFAKQAMMSTLGASLERLAPGACTIALPYDGRLVQQHGFVHAGVLATILDSACGYAAYTLMPAEAGVLSVDFSTHLLSPAKGERFEARAQVVRSGRNITVCRAEAWAIEGTSEKLCALMTGTMMTIRSDGLRG